MFLGQTAILCRHLDNYFDTRRLSYTALMDVHTYKYDTRINTFRTSAHFDRYALPLLPLEEKQEVITKKIFKPPKSKKFN